ncbi:hypothetical protein CPC08DRAFT_730141 [Agrocybe pediades]|nr:hypothetical protein CPC08DRAFT_730141 [Agrocybe pediades]
MFAQLLRTAFVACVAVVLCMSTLENTRSRVEDWTGRRYRKTDSSRSMTISYMDGGLPTPSFMVVYDNVDEDCPLGRLICSYSRIGGKRAASGGFAQETAGNEGKTGKTTSLSSVVDFSLSYRAFLYDVTDNPFNCPQIHPCTSAKATRLAASSQVQMVNRGKETRSKAGKFVRDGGATSLKAGARLGSAVVFVVGFSNTLALARKGSTYSPVVVDPTIFLLPVLAKCLGNLLSRDPRRSRGELMSDWRLACSAHDVLDSEMMGFDGP